jgi:hypothetical protein
VGPLEAHGTELRTEFPANIRQPGLTGVAISVATAIHAATILPASLPREISRYGPIEVQQRWEELNRTNIKREMDAVDSPHCRLESVFRFPSFIFQLLGILP